MCRLNRYPLERRFWDDAKICLHLILPIEELHTT